MLLVNNELDRFILQFRLYEKMRENPLFFNELIFKHFFWSKQKEIIFAIKNNRKVAVYSCHSIGKTFLTAFIFHWFLQTHPNSTVLTVSPSYQHLINTVWREIHKHADNAIGRLAGERYKDQWVIRSKWFGTATSPQHMEKLQGMHNDYVLILVDESSKVEEEIFEAIESLMTQKKAKMVLLGNPIRAEGYYYRTQFDPTFYKIRVSAFDTPNFTGEEIPEHIKEYLISEEWVEDAEKKYGKESNYYRSRVLALFPVSDSEQLFSSTDIEFCMSDNVLKEKKIPESPRIITCDIATEKGDSNVFIFWEGYIQKKIFDFGGVDTMKVVGYLMNAIKEFSPSYVVVDSTGVGQGVYDRLNELRRMGEINCDVYGVNFSEKPFDNKFENVKAEMWFNLATFIRNHEVKLIEHERLRMDLLVQEATVNSKGQIRMIDKKKIILKLGRSPDYGDATALRFVPSYKKAGIAVV